MRKILMIGLVISVMGMSACSDDEETQGSDVEISLDGLSRGQGVVEITGDESFSFSGTIFGANVFARINDKEYSQHRVTLRSSESGDEKKVLLYFYIPEALDRSVPPNGDIPVTFDLAGLDETYVAIFIEGDIDAYDSNSLTEGTLTVSESSDGDLSYNLEFDLRKFTSFDDREINLKGAIKY